MCEEIARLFERLVDSDIRPRDEKALRAHLAGCPACRARYALDLALIESIRTAPREAFESVAGEVAKGVRRQGRRRWVLRWGGAVAVIYVLGFLTGRFSSGIYGALRSLLTGSFRTSPAFLALSKVGGLIVEFAMNIKAMILSGTVPGGLDSYGPQVALLSLMAGALVVFMMYAMGRWLGKPTEVNSWRRG
jgi:anti-sigma factor RsiW